MGRAKGTVLFCTRIGAEKNRPLCTSLSFCTNFRTKNDTNYDRIADE